MAFILLKVAISLRRDGYFMRVQYPTPGYDSRISLRESITGCLILGSPQPVVRQAGINGDNNLENLRRIEQTWKVRLIEKEFQRLLFDVEDV